jgi:hypothetical protein
LILSCHFSGELIHVLEVARKTGVCELSFNISRFNGFVESRSSFQSPYVEAFQSTSFKLSFTCLAEMQELGGAIDPSCTSGAILHKPCVSVLAT